MFSRIHNGAMNAQTLIEIEAEKYGKSLLLLSEANCAPLCPKLFHSQIRMLFLSESINIDKVLSWHMRDQGR